MVNIACCLNWDPCKSLFHLKNWENYFFFFFQKNFWKNFWIGLKSKQTMWKGWVDCRKNVALSKHGKVAERHTCTTIGQDFLSFMNRGNEAKSTDIWKISQSWPKLCLIWDSCYPKPDNICLLHISFASAPGKNDVISKRRLGVSELFVISTLPYPLQQFQALTRKFSAMRTFEGKARRNWAEESRYPSCYKAKAALF